MKEMSYQELKKENAALRKENELLAGVRAEQAKKIMKLENSLEESKEELEEAEYDNDKLRNIVAYLLGKVDGLEGNKE